MSFTSVSISEQSSPGSLFSPAQESMMGLSAAGSFPPSIPETSSSLHMPDKSGTRTKSRPQRSGALPPDSHIPLADPSEAGKTVEPSPAKRRKSEPEPEEFRDKVKEGSLGLNEALWSPGNDRPKYRRTTSDGLPFPPPLMRKESTLSFSAMGGMYSNETGGRRINQPSDAATFFADTLVFGVTSSNLLSALELQLGIGRIELEGMKNALAGVFDNYRMERGMRDVSLASSHTVDSEVESVSAPLFTVYHGDTVEPS